jgi:hypothetical protein
MTRSIVRHSVSIAIEDRQTFATGTAPGQRWFWQATPQPEAEHADYDAKQRGCASPTC